jgi:hypothetical protein
MAYLNANIPVEYAQIRREYLFDLKKHHGEVEDCIDLMSFSSGIVLVIILLLLIGIS